MKIGFVFLFLLIGVGVRAQTATGTIKGTVTDSGGNAIPGAIVTLVHTTTGLTKTFTTQDGGVFTFALVQPGSYSLEIQARGFSTSRRNNCVVEVGNVTEVNVELSPGEVQEALTVSSRTETVQLDTAGSALGGVIERTRVDSLPLNGRNVFQLAQLEPGTNASPGARGANPDLTTTGEVSINGGRALNNEFVIDGIPLTNKGDNRVSLKPSVDSIQEFNIVTNSFSSEYGRTGGGAVNFSTRSGTSDFRGTVWEYLRNDSLDARSYFVNANPNGVKEKLRFNQFGGNIGGPIRFGPIKSNKLFFFFNFENLRISQSQQRQSTVPTELMRNGDFSELLGPIIPGVKVRDTAGNLVDARIGQIYVPGAVVPAGQPGAGSRIAFANNVIPASLQSPVALAALSYYPLPNAAGVLNSSGLGFSNNYVANSQLTTDARQYTGRIDYNISMTQQLFARVIKDDNRLFNSGPFPTSIASPQANPIQTAVPGTVVLSYVNSISPKLVLHLNAGGTRFNNDAESFSTGFDPTSLGLPAYIGNASDDTHIFPTFAPNGYTSLGPPRNFGFFRNNQDVFSFSEDLSILRGSHTIKVGANQRIYRAYNYRPDDPAGSFSFTRSFTSRTPNETAQQTGDAIASFLLGNPASGRLGIAPQIAIQSLYFAGFIQDDWVVNSKLTLNLGLRWESDLPNTERFNRLTNFDWTARFPVDSITVQFPGVTGLGNRTIPLNGIITPVARGGVENRENFDRDLNNWSPRIGLAWKVNDRTVLRAGGGIFYAPMSGGGFNTVTYALADLAETPFIASLDNGVTPAPGASLDNPFPSGIVPATTGYLGPLTSYGQQSIPVRLRTTRQPYVAQWNLNVQRELPGELLVQASYAGSAGIGLLGASTDLNQLSPEALALSRTLVDGRPLGNLAIANPFLNLPEDQRPPSNSILGRSTITIAQLLRPYPQFGNVVSYGHNVAHSSYHSLQLKASRRLVDGLTFTAGYTFSKLIDDLTSNSINLSIPILNYQDYYNRRGDKGLSNFDVRHRFVANASWELPFGANRRWVRDGWFGNVIGGFTLNAIVQAQSGLPISISATNPSLQGLSFIALRPDMISDPVIDSASTAEKVAQYFNTRAFVQPPAYGLGNTPRTLSNLRSPGYFATNFSLIRDFRLTEHAKIQLRVEAFNAFNRVNFLPPGSTLGLAGFGVITNTEDPRQLQIAVKIHF